MERDYSKLLVPNWFASDIQAYIGCSLPHANEIKRMTQKKYGVIPMDEGKKEQSVAADNVIKVLGGQDRLTELKIYMLFKGDKQ